jgi:hypothetical protein
MFRTELRTGATVITAVILTVALASFEVFNLATNREALQILTGSASWAIMLTIAGLVLLDFGGLARLFAAPAGRQAEALFLAGAWLISALVNAWLTRFAMLSAMVAGQVGNDYISREWLLSVVPMAGAVAVLLVRTLLIAGLTVSSAGKQQQTAVTQARQVARQAEPGQPLQLRPLEPGESRRPGRQQSPLRHFVINGQQ